MAIRIGLAAGALLRNPQLESQTASILRFSGICGHEETRGNVLTVTFKHVLQFLTGIVVDQSLDRLPSFMFSPNNNNNIRLLKTDKPQLNTAMLKVKVIHT